MVGHDGINGDVAEVTGPDSAPERRPVVERTLLFGIQEKEKALAAARRHREEALAEVTAQTDLIEDLEGELVDLKQAYARESVKVTITTGEPPFRVERVGDEHPGNSHPDDLRLRVVVKGVEHGLVTQPHKKVAAVVRAGLKAAGLPNGDIAGWELRDAAGALLPNGERVEDLDAFKTDILYLDPEAGAGA